MNVKLKHKDYGVTYELDDVIEFEATESIAELEAENTTMYAAILEAAEMGCVRCKVELQRIARKDAQK